MKYTIEKEVDIHYLVIQAPVRYWEDTSVNGEEDTDGSKIPKRVGDIWYPRINVKSGKIVGWPNGVTADIHYKVCDAGTYELYDINFEHKFVWTGDYVPDKLLAGGGGWGDYIIMKVQEDGTIEDWEKRWNSSDLEQENWKHEYVEIWI